MELNISLTGEAWVKIAGPVTVMEAQTIRYAIVSAIGAELIAYKESLAKVVERRPKNRR